MKTYSAFPTIVFDLDGTLADTAPDIVSTLNVILKSMGHPPLPYHEAINLVGSGARALLTEGLKAAQVETDAQQLEKLYLQFLTYYEAHIADETNLYPGAMSALEHLRNIGFPLAICTNKIERHAKLLLEKLGIADFFGAICGRDSFPYFKPDSRHLAMTIEQCGGDINHAIMVGDSITDINTAKNANLPVIAVSFGYSDTPVHQLNPDQVIEHYDNLFAAVEIILSKSRRRLTKS